MNQGDEQTERGSQPPALPSKQQAVITQAKRELMKMGTGTGASHQLKDLCTDRSSMLWIKSRTSGLFGYSSFQWKQKLLCCSRFCRTHIPFSSQILPLIPHTSDSYLLPERSFMPHCRRYLGIDCYLPIHLGTLPTLSWWTSNISQSLMQWNANKARPYQLHVLPHQLLYRTPSPWGFLYISGTWGCSFSRSSICMKTNLPTSVRGHITAQPPLGMENKAPWGACRIIRITLWVRTSSWRCGYTIGNPILHHTILICKNLPPRHRLHSCFCNPALLSTLPLLCPLPLATPHLPLWLPTRSLTSVYPVLVNLTFS